MTSESSFPNFSTSISKAISLQEIPGKLSPAILKRNTNDAKHSSNIEINSPVKNSSSHFLSSNRVPDEYQRESSEEILSLSSEEEPIIDGEQKKQTNDLEEQADDDDISQITSMQRCELMGVDKDHLVEMFIKLRGNYSSQRESSKK